MLIQNGLILVVFKQLADVSKHMRSISRAQELVTVTRSI